MIGARFTTVVKSGGTIKPTIWFMRKRIDCLLDLGGALNMDRNHLDRE